MLVLLHINVITKWTSSFLVIWTSSFLVIDRLEESKEPQMYFFNMADI